MTDPTKASMPDDEEERPLTEDELLALDISENRRLKELGIDPDADPLDIYLELESRKEARDALKRDAKEKRKDDRQD